MIDVMQATLESLQQMSESQLRQLGQHMRYDSMKYASIVFPHLLSEKWTDEKKIAFLNGELSRTDIFPAHHIKMYNVYDQMIDGDVRNAAFVLFREAAKTTH